MLSQWSHFSLSHFLLSGWEIRKGAQEGPRQRLVKKTDSFHYTFSCLSYWSYHLQLQKKRMETPKRLSGKTVSLLLREYKVKGLTEMKIGRHKTVAQEKEF